VDDVCQLVDTVTMSTSTIPTFLLGNDIGALVAIEAGIIMRYTYEILNVNSIAKKLTTPSMLTGVIVSGIPLGIENYNNNQMTSWDKIMLEWLSEWLPKYPTNFDFFSNISDYSRNEDFIKQ
jgi:hypothetical protein